MTGPNLSQDRKGLGFAISRYLHLNLLVHLAEKILLPQPFTFGEDYPRHALLQNRRKLQRLHRARGSRHPIEINVNMP